MSNTLSLTPLATFCSIRYVPLLALAHNSLFPSLTVEPDGVRIRVIRLHELKFDEIECITLRKRLAHQITIIPRRGIWTYRANVLAESAVRAVTVLRQQGAPLDKSALDLLLEGIRQPPDRQA